MLALGTADGDDHAVLWGRLWRVDAFAQLGRINDAEAELTLLAPAVARLRSPGPTWHLRRSQAALAVSAAATAQQLGMSPLLRETRSLTAALDGRPAGTPLTRREHEIASLIARGLTNRQIAAALHISERTAENHAQHILTKLGLHTRTQIAAWNAGSNTASP